MKDGGERLIFPVGKMFVGQGGRKGGKWRGSSRQVTQRYRI